MMWKVPSRSVVIDRPRLRRSETIVMVAPRWMIFKVALTSALVAAMIVEVSLVATRSVARSG